MFFIVRSNNSFNFPLGWIKYIVNVFTHLLPSRQTEATVQKKTNTCTDWHHPASHWGPPTIQTSWIHTSRCITRVQSESTERGTGTSRMSSGHRRICSSLTVLLTFQRETGCWMQNQLCPKIHPLKQSRLWYGVHILCTLSCLKTWCVHCALAC